jgi:hypothetical protein
VLVSGSGRDGTTLMMRLLGTSPQIAFDRAYPYEQRYFTYLLEWCRVLERREWSNRLWSGNPTNLLPRPHRLVGPIPWEDLAMIAPSRDAEPMWKSCFRMVWREFSERAAAKTRNDFGTRTPVIYFAEKYGRPWQLWGVDRLIQIRMLALLRDPRDVWASSIAFHRRREEGYFPVREGESEKDILSRFIRNQKTRFRWLAKISKTGEVPIFRYENLVMQLDREAERLSAWLKVDLNPDEAGKADKQMRGHMTAATARQSVSRWKQELSTEQLALFERELGSELRAFDFET